MVHDLCLRSISVRDLVAESATPSQAVDRRTICRLLPFLTRMNWISALLVVAGLFGQTAAQAQQPADPLDAINQSQPGFYVRASCDHASGIYEEGESMALTVKCEADAFLYVLYEQADGKKYQIFPNAGQRENRVPGGKEIHIPAEGDLFRWTVTPPFGKEKVFVIASKKPLESLSRPEQSAKAFNAINDKDLKGAALELDKQEKAWTEHSIEITTIARQARPKPDAGARRFGLFAGVSDYKFGPSPLNYATSDTTMMAKTFNEMGGIPRDNIILLRDEKATKAILKDVITRELAQMTRPGDTVFIYFSGHGGQMLDELPGQPGHDEADIWEEVLCTYDFYGWDFFVKLREFDAKGELNPKQSEKVRSIWNKWGDKLNELTSQIADSEKEMEKLKDRPDDDAEKKERRVQLAIRSMQRDSIITRETGVSDDEFGHWLQALDGRQVIVLLDICHGGGFDENAKQRQVKGIEKGLNGKTTFEFDFLGGEIDRLKDIGQRDVAMMAAAPADQPSIEAGRIWGSIFGYHLDKTMRQGQSQLTFERVFQEVKAGMAKWFAENDLGPKFKPHQPTMANYCTKMPIMRP